MTLRYIAVMLYEIFLAALIFWVIYTGLRRALIELKKSHYGKKRLYLLKTYPSVTLKDSVEVALCGAVTRLYFMDFSSGSLWSEWSYFGLAVLIPILWKFSLQKLLRREMELWQAFVKKYLKPFPDAVDQVCAEMHEQRDERKRRRDAV